MHLKLKWTHLKDKDGKVHSSQVGKLTNNEDPDQRPHSAAPCMCV